MTKTTDDNLDERMSETSDLQTQTQEIIDALSNADSVETPEDLDVTIDDAIEMATQLIKDLKAIRK